MAAPPTASGSAMEVDPPAAPLPPISADSEAPGAAMVGLSSPPKAKPEHTGVMAAPGTQGSVTVSIHPLVVMNISEHWTRIRAQSGKSEQVLGALIGKQEGRHLELMNSFEFCVTVIDGVPVVDMEFFKTREAQYKEVFETLEYLGWYTTGEMPNATDVTVHRQMSEINESPLFLKMNPQHHHQEKLPIFLFESVIDIVAGEAQMLFIPLPYSLVTEEAERIGVDHVARISRMTSDQNSVVAQQLHAQYGAIKMLFTRVKIILTYMNQVQLGLLPKNHEILREVKSLCSQLPVMNSTQFHGEFYNQCNDVSLITYLAMLTKTCNSLNQLVNKLNMVQERGFPSKRMKGLFI